MSDGSRPKVVVGSGWWSDGATRSYHIGHPTTRTAWFFEIWHQQVERCLTPARIVVTDSRSPLKPAYAAHPTVVWIELDANYGHANDIREGRIHTKYSGFTRSVLNGAIHALCCDADYYVYVEQDCLLKGDRLLDHAIGDSRCDILVGQATQNGRGLGTTPAAGMLQQSFMIVRRSGLERFICGLLGSAWTDGDVSPEEIMRRVFDPLDTVRIPFGRSRPIDYRVAHCYVHHLQPAELALFLASAGVDPLPPP
jgi:hypothetical protein